MLGFNFSSEQSGVLRIKYEIWSSLSLEGFLRDEAEQEPLQKYSFLIASWYPLIIRPYLEWYFEILVIVLSVIIITIKNTFWRACARLSVTRNPFFDFDPSRESNSHAIVRIKRILQSHQFWLAVSVDYIVLWIFLRTYIFVKSNIVTIFPLSLL